MGSNFYSLNRPKSQFAKPGPYTTALSPEQEAAFQNWVVANKIPWQGGPTSDYDMRGYYQAQQAGDTDARTSINPVDQRPHYPDTYKTPYHRSFSNESMYATPGAPHWEGQNLVPTQQSIAAPVLQNPYAPAMTAPDLGHQVLRRRFQL